MHQPLRQRRERAVDNFDDQLRHPARHLRQLPGGQRQRASAGTKNRIDNYLSRLMRMDHVPLSVGFQQAAANVEAGGTADFAGIKQGIVRGAAADIDIEYPTQALFGQGLRAGAVTSNDRLQMRPGARHHEIAK